MLRTFSQATAQRHRARKQHREGAEREEREAQRTGEVDFEGYFEHQRGRRALGSMLRT